MKTPVTPATLAIHALAHSIAAMLDETQGLGTEAADAAAVGDLNMTVGTLMAIEPKLASLKAQIDAVMALHRK